jgi:diaminopimelate decarboxylase
MVASNELDEMYFVETAKILFELVLEIEKEIGIQIEFVNL